MKKDIFASAMCLAKEKFEENKSTLKKWQEWGEETCFNVVAYLTWM